jgi:CHAT domain-containing protein
MKNKTTIIVALALCLCTTYSFSQGTNKEAFANKIDSLAMAGQKLAEKSELDNALQIIDEAQKIALAHFGEQSKENALCYYRRGLALFFNQQYQAAQENLQSADDLYVKLGDPMNKHRGSCANFLGGCFSVKGDYVSAEAAYLRAMQINKQAHGEQSALYLGSKSNYLNLLIDMGRYDGAIQTAKEILATREALVGKMHPEYALNLNQLGIIYATIGRYEEAEPILTEVSQIIEKTMGTENNNYASPIINLAAIYVDTRRYAEAEALSLKAKEIIEKTLGADHPYVAETTNNLGVICWKQQRYDEAAQYYLQTLIIREKILGKENPLYIGTQLNLGIVYLETGKLDEAESLFTQVKAAYQKTLGNQSLPYAQCLASEANLYVEKRRYEEAGRAYAEASGIFEQNQTTQHPNFAILLDRYARYQFLTGQTEAGIFTQKRELDWLENTAAKAATFMSEQELSDYTRTLSEAGNVAYSCLAKLPDYRNSLTPVCYNNALFTKGFLQNSVGQMRRLAQQNTETKEQFQDLTGFQRQLAAQYSLPNAERDSAKVAQLEANAQELEKLLVHNVAGYGEAVRQVAWQEVQAALQPGEAAVEFVHFKITYPEKTDMVQYAALVLRPGDAQPVFVPLCEEKQLNDLFKKRKTRRSDYVNDLYSSESTQLYDLIWKSMEPSLQGVKTIYYAPSGLLFRLNLAAIPVAGKQEEMLADRYHFVQLGSTRQLVVKAVPQAPEEKSALIYGGVIYDPATDSVPVDTAAASPFIVSRSRGELDFSATDSTLRGGSWGYLGWTEKEAEAVRGSLSASGFKTLLQSGLQASEEQFKSMGDPVKMTASPQVIHLATHGYFFPDTKNRDEVRGMRDDEPVFKTSDQPMIRSGLILAGGNHAWKTGRPLRPDVEDGILTAYEISQMDLSGTELVVLSACETGLGDIDGNEGVYGLQRAFKIAGAKYLVMSLWQVPDQQTQELMAAFYENWLTKKMGIPDAFRAAQQSVRDRYDHPFFWAGFVLVE